MSGSPQPDSRPAVFARQTARRRRPKQFADAAPKRALHLLRQSEERYQRLFHLCPDAVFVHEPGKNSTDSRILLANPACLQLLGASGEDQLVGKNPFDLIPAEFHATIQQRVRRILTHGEEAPVLELPFFRLDGALIRVEAVAAPFPHNGTLMTQVVLRDLTQRRRLEDERSQLARERAFLATAAETSEDAVIGMTLDAEQITHWNLGAERLYGWSAAEIIGKPFHLLVPEESRAEFERNRAALASLSTPSVLAETVRQCKDGSRVAVSVRVGVVYDPDTGVPRGLCSIARDITPRKQAERALREQAEFLHRLMESSRDCIKTLDLDGHLLWLNEGGRQVMEIDDFQAFCGADWLTFWDDEQTRRAVQAALTTARTGGIGRFQGFCPTAKGNPRWWDVTVVPILGPDGTPERLLGVSRDVTELKLVQQELETQLERESRVASVLREAVLPAIPPLSVPGLHLRAFHQSVAGAAEVGGDFYDVFPLGEGRYALVVGDVMGHGVTAAMSIARVRFALRGFLSENAFCDPADALRRLNRFLWSSRTEETVATKESVSTEVFNTNPLVALTLVVLHAATGALRVAAAGMDPVLIVRSGSGQTTDRVERLDAAELILGAMPDVRYRAERTMLGSGDLLAIATDGLTEIRSGKADLKAAARQQFGTDGLAAALLAASSEDSYCLESIGTSVLAQAHAFAGGTPQDDICLLLSRWHKVG